MYSFLAKHFGLVRLNDAEKKILFDRYQKEVNLHMERNTAALGFYVKHFCSRLTALRISFTYNKRTGIK